MAKKYMIKKFDGDDTYSWAVFNAADVRGRGTVIFYGQAKPIVSGLDRYSAQRSRDRLEKS